METFFAIFVRVAVIVIAVKLWRWARKLRNASQSAWRRRMGIALFLAPILLYLGQSLLPGPLQLPLRALVAVDRVLGAAPRRATRALAPYVPRSLLFGIEPLLAAGAYTAAGFVIGWPLDRLRRRPAAADPSGPDDPTTTTV